MLQIVKSIRILVAALACLWPIVFVTGLPAAATEIQVHTGSLGDGQSVFQRHEPSFFLDAVPAGAAVGSPNDGVAEPQQAAAGAPFSLGVAAVIAVLLLAAFNARKRRSRPDLKQV